MSCVIHNETVFKVNEYIRGLSRKSPAIVKITRMVCTTLYNLAAKESELECICMNKDDFTILVSGAIDATE